ncbi:hypothetical protein CR513_32499, partial [Mucuna pruriens]
MLDQVCNLENLECTNRAEVEVVEIKRPFSTQQATIFTTEIKLAREGRAKEKIKVNLAKKSDNKANIKIKSAREGRVKEKMKVNSAEKLSNKADTLVEAKPANDDQKQTRAKFTVPSGSDSEATQEVDANSNSIRIELTNKGWPKQPKAEIMSAHLVPSPNQVDQTDLKSLTEKSSSPPPPMELKPLSNHLKYAYFDKEQQLWLSLPTISQFLACTFSIKRDAIEVSCTTLKMGVKVRRWNVNGLLNDPTCTASFSWSDVAIEQDSERALVGSTFQSYVPLLGYWAEGSIWSEKELE